MKKIISFVKGIASGINDIINFVGFIFDVLQKSLQHLIYLVRYIGQCVAVAGSFIATLPAWVSAMAYLCMSIAVLYIVLGRNGGHS